MGSSSSRPGLTRKRSVLTLHPVGPGQPRDLDLGDLEPQSSGGRSISCTADGKRIAFIGLRPGGNRVAYVMDLEDAGAKPLAVSEEGAFAAVISPDGTKVAVADLRRGPYLAPAVGKDSMPALALPKDDIPLAWTSDGRGLLTWNRTLPARIYRTEIDGGRRELVQEIVPPDPVGLLYALGTLSPDGRYHLMRYRKVLSPGVPGGDAGGDAGCVCGDQGGGGTLGTGTNKN